MSSNEKTTFDFGNGPVAAHQHPNGGGWVADTATVGDTARVSIDAWVFGDAQVCDNAKIYGNAKVCGNALVSGNAEVYGNAQVSGDAKVYGKIKITGNAVIKVGDFFGEAIITQDPIVIVSGKTQVILTPDCVICGLTYSMPISKWFQLTDQQIRSFSGPLYEILITYLEKYTSPEKPPPHE